MKKLVKILGLLLVAGALFVGCKQDVDPMSAGSPALFKDSEVKQSADKLVLSDGDWNFTMVESFDSDTETDYLVMEEYGYGKVVSNKLSPKAVKMKEKIKLDDDDLAVAKQMTKDQLKEMGEAMGDDEDSELVFTNAYVDGSYFVIEMKATEAALESYEMDFGDGSKDDNLEITIKTNSKKTKYKVTYNMTEKIRVTMYFSKR